MQRKLYLMRSDKIISGVKFLRGMVHSRTLARTVITIDATYIQYMYIAQTKLSTGRGTVRVTP